MAKERFYQVNAGGLLLTRCQYTGYLIGGGECMECKHFEGKQRKYRCVKCRRV